MDAWIDFVPNYQENENSVNVSSSCFTDKQHSLYKENFNVDFLNLKERGFSNNYKKFIFCREFYIILIFYFKCESFPRRRCI